jgi:hypothetical protein
MDRRAFAGSLLGSGLGFVALPLGAKAVPFKEEEVTCFKLQRDETQLAVVHEWKRIAWDDMRDGDEILAVGIFGDRLERMERFLVEGTPDVSLPGSPVKCKQALVFLPSESVPHGKLSKYFGSFERHKDPLA